MKRMIKFLATFTVLGFATAASAQPIFQSTNDGSELVTIAAERIFVPAGFDDNDQAMAVLDGYLPDSCYRVTHNEVITDPETGVITVIQMARRFDSLCLPVRIPYWTEVDLGVLPFGAYDVRTAGAPTKALVVNEATNAGPDDYLYAPVESARVEADFTNNRYTAVIQGRFTNTCMGFQDVRLEESEGSFVLLPIVELEDRGDCIDAEIPFSRMVELPDGMAPDRYLLHVRSLNGKAINHMFTVAEPSLPPVE